MPKRRTLLLGLVMIGGAALLADRTFVSNATAQIDGLTGLVQDAKEASAIAETLGSGDPVQIQDLLNRLVTEEGTSPENARAGLFQIPGLPAAAAEPGADTDADAGPGRPGEPSAAGETRVSMIITTPNGGLAVINGAPMREGDESRGVRLLAVHPDRVVIEEGGGRRVVQFPQPGQP